MIWVWSALGAIVLLAACVFGIGWMLPAGHHATRSLRLGQSADAVWDTITAVERSPQWRKDLSRVELLEPADGRRRWREIGGSGTLTLVEEHAARPKAWTTRIDDRSLPYGGTWRFEIAPEADGCRLRITEAGEVYNPLFRFMSRFVFGHHATIEGYLHALAAKFGERGSIEP